jgi:hypothetical protein
LQFYCKTFWRGMYSGFNIRCGVFFMILLSFQSLLKTGDKATQGLFGLFIGCRTDLSPIIFTWHPVKCFYMSSRKQWLTKPNWSVYQLVYALPFTCVPLMQCCQMLYFQTKKPNLGKFWRALEWKMLVFFVDLKYIKGI